MKQTGNQNKKNFYDIAAKNGTSEVKQIEEKKRVLSVFQEQRVLVLLYGNL